MATAEMTVSFRIPNTFYKPSPQNNVDVLQRLQAVFAPREIFLSENKPENYILSPSFMTANLVATPGSFYPDELLDWDMTINIAPKRPSGTLMVTLKYAGRGKPSPAEAP